MSRARSPRTRRTPLLALTGLVVAALTACTPAPVETPTPTPRETVAPSGDGVLRIGTLFPTTGATAFLGAAQVAGVNAAIREINAAGGVLGAPVEVVNRDSGDASTETAEASFAALVERGADVVIGPSSSTLAERLLPLAAEAGIPLISPAATYPWLTEADTEGWLFRTVPSYAQQGAALAASLDDAGAAEVVLVTNGEELALSLVEPLGAALADVDAELVATVDAASEADVAAAVARVRSARPDAVVLATPDNGELTRALIGALVEAGFGGDTLWLTSQNLADYSQSLPPGMLEGTRGLLEGAPADEAFVARLKLEDPGLASTRYSVEAYDAAMIAALAAIMAADDGGPSIASRLVDATRDGIRCISFGECADVLATEPDIAYEGLAGPLRLDDAGDPVGAGYGVYTYDAENRFRHTGSASG